MALTKENIESIEQTWDDFYKLKYEFDNFNLTTRIQLLASQMQLYQVIASITIALIGILISLKVIQINWWLILSGIISISLVTFTSSYTKEKIDSVARELNQTQTEFNIRTNTLRAIINETIENKDFTKFESYITRESKSKNQSQSEEQYAGEIVIFFFLMSIFLGITSVLATEYCSIFTGLFSVFIFLTIIILSIILSFKKWSIGLVSFISTKINLTAKKNFSEAELPRDYEEVREFFRIPKDHE